MAKTVHVYLSDKGWAVKREGGSARSVFSTQREAIESARVIALKAAPSQMVVHGRDGRIRDHVTHGLPKVQDPPGRNAAAKRIQKAVGKLVLERLTADPRPRRA